MKVALLTPYDGGNLGDAAIQEALIGNFRKYDPQVQLYGITLHPESTAARHHIPCYPLAAISRPYYHAKKGAALSPNNYAATSHIERSVETSGLFAAYQASGPQSSFSGSVLDRWFVSFRNVFTFSEATACFEAWTCSWLRAAANSTRSGAAVGGTLTR